MQSKITVKKPINKVQNRAPETLRDDPSTFFDQFDYSSSEPFYGERSYFPKREKPASKPQRREFTVFNYSEYYERENTKRQIKELTEHIKQEIELIKKADKALLSEVSDIENLTMESLPQKPGVYHVRFLELILSILKTIRTKIGESKTWMQALMSRKKKRGSLFLALSKKKGTQYSLSQELQSTRSVQ